MNRQMHDDSLDDSIETVDDSKTSSLRTRKFCSIKNVFL